jgi:hypothetical protein
MSPIPWVLLSVAVALGLSALALVSVRGRDRARVDERLRLLAQSGSLIAQGTCGGRVGSLYINNVNLQAAVYPGGVAIDGFLLGVRVILAAEIRAVRWTGTRLFGGLVVEHQGVDCSSPVLLRTGRKSALAAAIFQIAERRGTAS